jgi:caa(3)-type oxidase subunit IV
MSDETTTHARSTTAAPAAGVHQVPHNRQPAAAASVDVHHVQLEQKRFLIVYAVLIVGTVLTVGMYYVHFEAMWQTVGVALLIAAVKGTFVAAVFMHLWHGERDIYRILLYTGVVVVGLFTLTILSMFSVPGSGLYLR